MSQRITRRQFGARLAGGIAAASGASALAQESKSDAKPEADHPSLPSVERLLAKPLPEEMKRPVSDALKYLESLSEKRWKHKLADTSEPANIFPMEAPKGR